MKIIPDSETRCPYDSYGDDIDTIYLSDQDIDRIVGKWLDIIDPNDKVQIATHEKFSEFFKEQIEKKKDTK